MLRLSEVVEASGYKLIISDCPANHPKILGSLDIDSKEGNDAFMCEGGEIVCLDDSWDYAYSVAHEIAEFQHGFKHTEEMFCLQANILAAWLKMLSMGTTFSLHCLLR